MEPDPATPEVQIPDPAEDLVCPYCGYCLRGLPESVCPECGQGFDAAELRRSKAVRTKRVRDALGLVFAIATIVWSVMLSVDLIQRATFRAAYAYSMHAFHGFDSDSDVLLYLIVAPMFVAMSFAGKLWWPGRAARIAWMCTTALAVSVWLLVDRVP